MSNFNNLSTQAMHSLSAWNKRGALEEIENLKVIRANAWDEHTHSFRWLMASLLAINGGACLSVFGQDGILLNHRFVACGAFIVGILGALLVAVFGQRSIQHSLVPLQKFIAYWMTVADDGERDEKMETELTSELQTAAKIGLGSRISGWLAAISFVTGVVIAGNGLMEKGETAPIIRIEGFQQKSGS